MRKSPFAAGTNLGELSGRGLHGDKCFAATRWDGGAPLDEHGREGRYAATVRVLAADIERRSGRPVVLWDERFSTARALQAVRATGGTTKGRKADLDALAATVLLQHYLDTRRGGAT